MPAEGLTRTETVRAEFIASMGRYAQAEGLSPIAGRIVALMVFDGHVYSFGDLAIALKVSRASISNNTRFLVEAGMLELIERPGDRRDYFRLVPNGLSAMLRGVEMRARDTEAMIRATASALEEGDDARAARLADLAGFYETLADAFRDTVAKAANRTGDDDDAST
jgi:DNA-binding transcriptional regulator GbsR (MarR family)